jgi:Family of unknown function (DUF6627)
MTGIPTLRRFVALTLAVVMFVLMGPIGAARAALVSTEQVIGASAAAADRDRVAAFLGRDDVRRQMVALGVDPMEAAARVQGLSDAEVHQIAGHLDQLPAGQDAIVAVIGAAVFIFLVLLITDLLGLTHIFPFVHHAH